MHSQFPEPILERIEACGVIAVLVVDDADNAVQVAKTLLDSGITAMELTLRTDAALPSLHAVRQRVPEMLAGIGTILRPDQVQSVLDAGAEFGVAPGLNPSVVLAAQEAGIPFAPGIATPSDIERAVELGCSELKFFPAEAGGGMKYLSSMAAPYQHLGLRYIPLGGINVSNMVDYLANVNVPAVGGSWIATRDLIRSRDWHAIAANATAARAAIDRERSA